MTDSVIIELVILALLLIVNFRVFVRNKMKNDVFVVFAPTALVLSLLLLFAWKPDIPIITVFLLSILVCIVNLHSLARFAARLFIDHYSPAMYLSCIINIIVIIAAGTAIFIYRPLPLSADDLGATEQKIMLTGSYRTGFSERTGIFEPYDAELSRFLPEPIQEPLPLVLFVTDPRGTVARSMPFAATLASYGYEVIVADFNLSLVGSALLRGSSLFFPDAFNDKKQEYIRTAVMQYVALLDLYGRKAASQGRAVFLAGEGICRQAAFSAAVSESGLVSGIYTINGENSADIPLGVSGWFNGYGAVRQQAPWLSALLSALKHPEIEFAAESADLPAKDILCADAVFAAEQANMIFKEKNQNDVN